MNMKKHMIFLLCMLLMGMMIPVCHAEDDTIPSREEQIEVIELCCSSLTEQEELNFSEARLLKAEAEKVISGEYLNGEESVWIVTFTDHAGNVQYRYLLGENGEWMDHTRGDGRFTNTQRKQSEANLPLAPDDLQLMNVTDLYDENGAYFYFRSLEDKAVFCAAWKQKVDEIYGKDETARMILEGKEYYWWTRRVWGTPGTDGISEEKILETVSACLTALGKDAETIFDPVLFYDVTDPALPQWRVCVNHRYYMILDAVRGDLLFLEDNEHGSIEALLMKN